MVRLRDTEWLTVSQVAEILGTSTETVRRMIKAGEFPASRASALPRAAWLISRAAFEAHQREAAELAAVRQRLAGLNAGHGHQDPPGFLGNQEKPPPRLALRVGEAAATLGVSEDHFHDHIAPQLRWVRQGRLKIVAVSELQRWLDDNATGGPDA